MATIPKVSRPFISTGAPSSEHQLAGLYAGEAIEAGDACFIDDDNLIYKWVPGEKLRGFASINTPAGDGVTLWWGVNFHYGSGLTPGADIFLSSAVPGGLDDATSAGAAVPVGFAVDATRIHFFNLVADVAGA